MERKQVKSSRVLSIGWESGILEVEFKGGSIYQYHPVDESTAKELTESVSIGSDLQLIIKTEGIVCDKIFPAPQNEASQVPVRKSNPFV